MPQVPVDSREGLVEQLAAIGPGLDLAASGWVRGVDDFDLFGERGGLGPG